jgi:hypothetical protein
MGEVVSITGAEFTAPGEPDKGIVSLLETYLADAKAGNLCAIAIVALDHELTSLGGQSIMKGRTTLIGALGLLQYRLYQSIDAGNE